MFRGRRGSVTVDNGVARDGVALYGVAVDASVARRHISVDAFDASGQPLVEQPPFELYHETALSPYHSFAANQLLSAGLKMARDGKSVFNYNPGRLTSGANFLRVWAFAPRILGPSWWAQLVFMYAVCFLWLFLISDSEMGNPGADMGPLDVIVGVCYAQIAGLTKFVLGLHISLALARTYYANRGVFGTVFGSTMGFSQKAAAWIRSPQGNHHSARAAQALLVRWMNAAYRLLVLEVRGVPAEEIGAELRAKGLLSSAEWSHVSGLSSRATHIYQWVNNVLGDLQHAGYLAHPSLLQALNQDVDACRGANVWGLPSLPMPYTLLVTTMVKAHLTVAACSLGGFMRQVWPKSHPGSAHEYLMIASECYEIFIQNLLYQGFLDLHGMLYSPNGGLLAGHLPAGNFLDFVQRVTTAVVNESGCAAPQKLPYRLELDGEVLGAKETNGDSGTPSVVGRRLELDGEFLGAKETNGDSGTPSAVGRRRSIL